MSQTQGWTTETPKEALAAKHKILRCPPVRLRPHIVLSHEILYTGIHWVSRRSIQCQGEATCEHCKKQKPTWKGYLSVWLPESNVRYCLEITPPCFEPCGAYKQLYGTLRGSQITLTRRGVKENGRMSAELQPSGLPEPSLPQPIDVEETMRQAWDSPNKSDRQPMQVPRDTAGGDAALNKLIAELQRRGLADTNGQLIEQPIVDAAPKTNGIHPRFKLSKTYEATPEQKAMLAANKANGSNKPKAVQP